MGSNTGTDRELINSYASVIVTGDTMTGGLVGYNNTDIIKCYSSSTVKGVTSTGGLVGHTEVGTIANSYSTGNVAGRNRMFSHRFHLSAAVAGDCSTLMRLPMTVSGLLTMTGGY